jgi:hypothetical protein
MLLKPLLLKPLLLWPRSLLLLLLPLLQPMPLLRL